MRTNSNSLCCDLPLYFSFVWWLEQLGCNYGVPGIFACLKVSKSTLQDRYYFHLSRNSSHNRILFDFSKGCFFSPLSRPQRGNHKMHNHSKRSCQPRASSRQAKSSARKPTHTIKTSRLCFCPFLCRRMGRALDRSIHH